MALDGGSDGLDFYRRIAAGGWKHLTSGGMLAVEVGDGQAEAVAELLREEERYRDLQILTCTARNGSSAPVPASRSAFLS